MADDVKQVVKNLPDKPGVYRYYGKGDSLLYIGKAKNLKKRVSSYFQEGRIHNQRLRLMVSQIEKIEYTVVSTEKEALLLEANLVHNLQPKYNILLKDDKSYVYVRISNHPVPGVFLVRRKFDPASRYFGPYTGTAGIFSTIRTIRSILPFCQEKTHKNRPCSYYQIKQCDGICAGLESMENYQAKLDQIAKILSGRTEEVEQYIIQKMNEAAQLANFELAALWRNRLRSLKESISNQKVVLSQPEDIDLLTLIIDTDPEGLEIGSVFIQNIRDGKIVNVNNFLLSGTENLDTDEAETSDSLAFNFLQRFLSSYSMYFQDKVPIQVQVFGKNADYSEEPDLK